MGLQSLLSRHRDRKDSNSSSDSEIGLDEYDVDDRLLSPAEQDMSLPYKSRTKPTIGCKLTIMTTLNILLFIMSVIVFATTPLRSPSQTEAIKMTSAYSPVLEKGRKIQLVERGVSGKLFPHDDGTDELGRLEPGPATDEKWSDFEYQRMFAISGDEVRRLGKDPATTIKFPIEYGLGDDMYMTGLDVFHQIHCLNVLRIEAFKDYYWDGERHRMEMYDKDFPPRRTHTEFYWIHLRHCTDILLQALQCGANTEMITMTWLETQQHPWPDFNIRKMCKSFDAIKQWRDENAEPREKINALKKPGDLQRVEDRYWELFGNATHSGDNVHHPIW